MNRIFALALAALLLSGCGAKKYTPSPQSGIESKDKNNWTVEVNDTKKGVYEIPGTGKSMDIEATLILIAAKDGGGDIFGNYKGRWLLTFEADIKKLSDPNVQFAGNVIFDRMCDDLTFSIQPYNRQEYNKIKKSAPGGIADEQLVDMKGMSSFISQFGTVKWENWKASEKGKILIDRDSNFLDGEKIPVGINILTNKEEAVVDIPTYSSVWKLGFFRGSISQNKKGKDTDELFLNRLSEIAAHKKGKHEEAGLGKNESTGICNEDPDGRKGFDTDGDGNVDTWYDKDGNMQSGTIQGGYITDSDGHEGIDTNGDGKLEMWFDEDGNTHADLDGDGKWDIIKGEYSEG